MAQKIFDTDNEEDMALLWSILPDNIIRIRRIPEVGTKNYKGLAFDSKEKSIFGTWTDAFPKIDWHDKIEIIRSQEATYEDIGKLCKFWDSDDGLAHYGILNSIGSEAYRLQNTYPYTECYHHCRRLTKQEIEELC